MRGNDIILKTIEKKNLRTDDNYRKAVSWQMFKYGLQIAYQELTPKAGLDKAYLFLMKHAPSFKARFMNKAKHLNIYSNYLKGLNPLNVHQQDFQGHYDWRPITGKLLPYTKATRLCQVIGMDIWDILSPSDDDCVLLKPYQAYENLLLSIIIP